MKYLASITSLLLLAAALTGALLFLPEDDQSPPLSAPEQPLVRQQPSAELQPTLTESATASREKSVEKSEAEEESSLPPGMTEEEARLERRRQELAAAADKRFNETVATDSIKPDQVEPAVRKMFKTLKLQPEFDPENGREGFIDGMRIAQLMADNPLAQAGFKKGDRITRFNGQPLEDPAQVAHLFTSLGTSFEVCAEQGSGERCRLINLPTN